MTLERFVEVSGFSVRGLWGNGTDNGESSVFEDERRTPRVTKTVKETR